MENLRTIDEFVNEKNMIGKGLAYLTMVGLMGLSMASCGPLKSDQGNDSNKSATEYVINNKLDTNLIKLYRKKLQRMGKIFPIGSK